MIVGDSYGLPTVTFTGGAGTVPDDAILSLLKGKVVKICYDIDIKIFTP